MRVIGILIFIASILGFVLYTYLLIVSQFDILILKLTILGLIAIIAILFAFIGLNMALVKKE